MTCKTGLKVGTCEATVDMSDICSNYNWDPATALSPFHTEHEKLKIKILNSIHSKITEV